VITKEELIAFEANIAAEFNAGHIRAPIHLSGGNEDQLIEIFQNVKQDDWVCSTWRSHYHCLLHGVPPEQVKAAIMAGRSITLCFPEYRVISSAIVGGIIPIALGLAWAEKRKGSDNKVWVFVGDMTAETGVFHECCKYASWNDLPLHLVIEDNGISVCTPTDDTWGSWDRADTLEQYYEYQLKWPHSGAGKRVEF
jgi:TPP-dependent pyruvate/acetoin dehydrogenase alpha subunit